jgi:O-antigen/teichoic acid export membrane protein
MRKPRNGGTAPVPTIPIDKGPKLPHVMLIGQVWRRAGVNKWWKSQIADSTLRRILRNMAYLFSANALVAAIGLVTVAIMARALGPSGLGAIALAEAYVRLVDQFIRLEPWQAVIRYGALALENGKEVEFRRLVKFSTLFDILGGCLAAIVAITTCILISSWLGFGQEQKMMTIIYSATLFFALSATPTGLLRIFDLFDLAAKLSVFLALCRLVLTVATWLVGGDIWTFIIILSVYTIGEHVAPFVLAWRELRRRGHSGIWRTPLTGIFKENPGILRFIVNTNLNVLARLSTQRFDTLIVGAVLGISAAGFYQLARRVGLAAHRIGRPIQQAIYPDLARIWARGEKQRFRRMVLRISASLTIFSTVAILGVAYFMELIVEIAFGEAFKPVTPLINIQLFAVALFLSGNILGPALMSMGADKALMTVSIIATAAFFVAIVPLVELFGTAGAVLCQVIFNLIFLTGSWGLFLRFTAGRDTKITPD